MSDNPKLKGKGAIVGGVCNHRLKGLCGCPPANIITPVEPEPSLEDEQVTMLEDYLSDPDVLETVAKEIYKSDLTNSLSYYIREMWHVIEPGTQLTWNWHHELMCRVLQGMFEDWEKAADNPAHFKQRVKNAIFNVPPGSLKSRIIAVGFPTWVWTRRPGVRFICLSVNIDAAQRDARDSRTVIRSDWYRGTFEPEWDISDDQDAITNYGNTAGGVRLSRAQGSEIVGLRGDCLAGESLVSTEWGTIPIRVLHQLHQSGSPLPKVWSQSNSGSLELKSIQATRRLDSRVVCEVRTKSDNVLRCTDDHRIYSEGNYTQAAHLAGRTVSVMRKSDLSVKEGNSTAVQGLSVCKPDLCAMSHSISETGCGVRQTCEARADSRPLLLEILQDDAQSACDYQGVSELSEGFPSAVNQGVKEVLFNPLSGQLPHQNEAIAYIRGSDMSPMWDDVPAHQFPHGLLYEKLREQGSQCAYDRIGELQLLRDSEEDLPGWTLGESGTSYSRTGRISVCRMPISASGGRTRSDSTSYRPQPQEQRTRELDYTLQHLSHDTPQIEDCAVLSVNKPTHNGSRIKIPVYDIQVEGNHNFFANGILVHNCILNDDPNNPKEAESKTVRDEVNELWDTNIHNRVNDPIRSMRIGVQQRTHALDWTGYVTHSQGTWHPTENPDGWLMITIPAEFEPERRCITPWGKDPRTEPGESIDNVRAPKEWLVKERQRFGSAKYAGQMQQRPALAEGGRVKKVWWKWFKLVDEGRHGRLASASYPLPYPKIRTNGNGRPRGCDTLEGARIVKPDSLVSRWDFDWIYITIDPAIKKTVRGSNFGILVAGGQGARRFILEDATQKGDIVEILALLEQLVKRWKPDRVLIEDKASGPDIIKMFQEKLGNGDIKDELGQTITTIIEPVNPGVADKEMRLDACIPQIEGGMVYLLEGCDWEEFVDEFAMFPNGLNDDRCDALSQLLNHVKTVETILPDW